MKQFGGLGKSSGAANLVLWVMWFAFGVAVVFYRLMLVGPRANTHSIQVPDAPLGWACYLIPIVVVMSLRWLLIPKLRIPPLTLIPFVVSCAFAEALTFFGIFLFPREFNFYFLTSCLLILQLMPLWTLKADQHGT